MGLFRTPTDAAIVGMDDSDVRLLIMKTSLLLLQQLADTLCELAIGGNEVSGKRPIFARLSEAC